MPSGEDGSAYREEDTVHEAAVGGGGGSDGSKVVSATTGAGLGLDASYLDRGRAKVEQAIARIMQQIDSTSLDLTNGQIPVRLQMLARDEALRAIGITRLAVLTYEKQWGQYGQRVGLQQDIVINQRGEMLSALSAQLSLLTVWDMIELIEKDRKLIAEVDKAIRHGAFDTAIPISRDDGLDMRVVAGVLALRESKSKLVTEVLHFDPGSGPDKHEIESKAKTMCIRRDGRIPGGLGGIDYQTFRRQMEQTYSGLSLPKDIEAAKATTILMKVVFPGFENAKLKAMEKLIPQILTDISLYDSIFAGVRATDMKWLQKLGEFQPQKLTGASFTAGRAEQDGKKFQVYCLEQGQTYRLVGKDEEIKVDTVGKIHVTFDQPLAVLAGGDPMPNTLHFLMIMRNRAGSNSIHFYNTIHSIIASQLPAGCQAAAMPGLVKAEQRLIFKSLVKYAGLFTRCRDVVRLTIRVETAEEVYRVLIALDDSEIHIVRMKNRLDPEIEDQNANGGYRDVQLTVAFKRDRKSHEQYGGPEYAVGEIQINLAPFINVKEGVESAGGGGHGPYKFARSFKGYDPDTIIYRGKATMECARKISQGLVLTVELVEDKDEDKRNEIIHAMKKALNSTLCRLQHVTFVKAEADAFETNFTAAGIASMAEPPVANSRNGNAVFKNPKTLVPIMQGILKRKGIPYHVPSA